MGVCACPRPEIESSASKYTIEKVSFKAGIPSIKWVEVVDIVRIKVGCPSSKTGWVELVSQGIGAKSCRLLTGTKTSNADYFTIA